MLPTLRCTSKELHGAYLGWRKNMDSLLIHPLHCVEVMQSVAQFENYESPVFRADVILLLFSVRRNSHTLETYSICVTNCTQLYFTVCFQKHASDSLLIRTGRVIPGRAGAAVGLWWRRRWGPGCPSESPPTHRWALCWWSSSAPLFLQICSGLAAEPEIEAGLSSVNDHDLISILGIENALNSKPF